MGEIQEQGLRGEVLPFLWKAHQDNLRKTALPSLFQETWLNCSFDLSDFPTLREVAQNALVPPGQVPFYLVDKLGFRGKLDAKLFYDDVESTFKSEQDRLKFK